MINIMSYKVIPQRWQSSSSLPENSPDYIKIISINNDDVKTVHWISRAHSEKNPSLAQFPHGLRPGSSRPAGRNAAEVVSTGPWRSHPASPGRRHLVERCRCGIFQWLKGKWKPETRDCPMKSRAVLQILNVDVFWTWDGNVSKCNDTHCSVVVISQWFLP